MHIYIYVWIPLAVQELLKAKEQSCPVGPKVHKKNACCCRQLPESYNACHELVGIAQIASMRIQHCFLGPVKLYSMFARLPSSVHHKVIRGKSVCNLTFGKQPFIIVATLVI